MIFDGDSGEVRNPTTQVVQIARVSVHASPTCLRPARTSASSSPIGRPRRRTRTSPRATSIALWSYLLGPGFIEPVDDIRAGNPATNPELLDRLTADFIASGFDVQNLQRFICKSRVYQLSIATNKWNEDDTVNYSHATARRLPAEVLYDAVFQVTGATRQLSGMPAGARAAEERDPERQFPRWLLGPLRPACPAEFVRMRTVERR